MRSSCYDDLLAAETRAMKNGKGLHSKKVVPIHRVADISGVRKLYKNCFQSKYVLFVSTGQSYKLRP